MKVAKTFEQAAAAFDALKGPEPEPQKVDTQGMRPGIYQARDGFKYRVFADGSAFRLVKRVKHKGKFITVPGEYGDTMVRMGRVEPKKVNAVPAVATQSATVPSVPVERTAAGAAP